MRKRAIFALAASSALLPASAFAMQQNLAAPPNRWEDVPSTRLNVAPKAGVSWQNSAAAPKVAPVTVNAPMVAPIMQQPMHPGPVMQHSGPGPGMHHGGKWQHHGGTHHFQRVGPGWRMPPFWFAPRFHVNNWQVYGFSAPMNDWRWIRYYDDALLVDRYGTVHDLRTGIQWDRYGERWDHEGGIPAYVGRGDFRPGDRDHEYVENYQGSSGFAGAQPYGCGCYGYGGATIIETTVTTSPSVVEKTYYVEEEVRPKLRKRRPAKYHYREPVVSYGEKG